MKQLAQSTGLFKLQGEGNQLNRIKQTNETQVIHMMKEKRKARPDFKIKHETW